MTQAQIHPKVAEISHLSNQAYVQELIDYLARKDCGRKRTLHQSTINEIKRFHMNYKLSAEQYVKEESQILLGLKEGLAFILFCGGLCSLLTLAFIWMGN